MLEGLGGKQRRNPRMIKVEILTATEPEEIKRKINTWSAEHEAEELDLVIDKKGTTWIALIKFEEERRKPVQSVPEEPPQKYGSYTEQILEYNRRQAMQGMR